MVKGKFVMHSPFTEGAIFSQKNLPLREFLNFTTQNQSNASSLTFNTLLDDRIGLLQKPTGDQIQREVSEYLSYANFYNFRYINLTQKQSIYTGRHHRYKRRFPDIGQSRHLQCRSVLYRLSNSANSGSTGIDR